MGRETPMKKEVQTRTRIFSRHLIHSSKSLADNYRRAIPCKSAATHWSPNLAAIRIPWIWQNWQLPFCEWEQSQSENHNPSHQTGKESQVGALIDLIRNSDGILDSRKIPDGSNLHRISVDNHRVECRVPWFVRRASKSNWSLALEFLAHSASFDTAKTKPLIQKRATKKTNNKQTTNNSSMLFSPLVFLSCSHTARTGSLVLATVWNAFAAAFANGPDHVLMAIGNFGSPPAKQKGKRQRRKSIESMK